MEQLRTNRSVVRPYIGIKLYPLDSVTLKHEKAAGRIPKNMQGGVVVAAVAPSSPAERAGLKEGDVIVNIDGAEVKRNADVFKALGVKVNTPLRMTIVRTKPYEQRLEVSITPDKKRGR